MIPSERTFRLQARFVSYFTVLTAAIMALVFLLVDQGVGDVLGAHAERRRMRLVLLGVALLATALGAVGSLFLARRIARPLALLAAGTRRAAAGDLESRLDLPTGDEMEDLARAFNEMIGQIRANQRAVEEMNRDLEAKIQARTGDLEWTNAALLKAYEDRQQAEAQMILTEKMASLGQFVAGIAHEINTPSSAIGAAIVNVTAGLQELARDVPRLAAEGPPAEVRVGYHGLVEKALAVDFAGKRASTAEVRQRTRELEPILAGGGLPAPRELALAFSRLGLHEELRRLVESAPRRLSAPALAFLESAANLAIAVGDIRVSIEAITRMVKALRHYSHLDRAEMAEADLHDGLETTLTILRNQVRYGIVVERRYSRLPPVVCNTNELNQVWTNVIHNAIQAMNGVGRLTIETAATDGGVSVRISDTGPGIPDAIRGRIFDPFFTTKDQGEGTGLGLGIAQQIVQRHGGQITVESEPGRTSFEVRLPLRPVAARLPESESEPEAGR